MIKIDNISLQLQGKPVLCAISAQIKCGDYLAVVGPNGAGKSSLLKCLGGMLPVDSGQISLNDQPLADYSSRQRARQISYVPQDSGRQLPFSVEEFVIMARYPYHNGLSAWQTDDRDAVEQALLITNTTAFRNRQIQTLSGGEAQRVMMAAALCQQSPIMLLDEPASYLDPHHQTEIHQLISRLNRQHGITIIEVTHDINHASQHARQVLALKNGQLLWHGQAAVFLNTERLYDLYRQIFILTPHPKTGVAIALTEQ